MVISAKTLIGIEVQDSELYTTKEVNGETEYYDLYGNKLEVTVPPIFGWNLNYGPFDMARARPGDAVQYIGLFTSQLRDSNAHAELDDATQTQVKSDVQELLERIGFGDREIKVHSFLYIDNR